MQCRKKGDKFSFAVNHNECRSCKLKKAHREKNQSNSRDMKKCNSCLQTKQIQEFYYSRGYPLHKCKKCCNIESHDRNLKNKQLLNTMQKMNEEIDSLKKQIKKLSFQ